MNHLTYLAELSYTTFLTSLVIQSVMSTPALVGRWAQPCHGRTAMRHPVLVTPSPEPEADDVVAQKLLVKAQEIVQLSNLTKNNYFSARIQSTELQLELDVSPSLTGFPAASLIASSTTFIERLKEDYRRASVAAVFLEEVRTDEEISSEADFAVDYRILESKLYPFLCQLHSALKNRSVTDIPYVTRNVMTLNDRNTGSSAQRYNRDYKILKDIVRLFQAIGNGYVSFRARQTK